MCRRASVLLTMLLAATPGAQAQFPAELAGRVLERGTSVPIEGALVEVPGSARTLTDVAGAFVLRVSRGGPIDVVVTHPGHAALRATVVLEPGRTALRVWSLEPAPYQLDPIEVIGAAEPGFAFTREQIEASGARTLGELLRSVPGVVVRETTSGGVAVSIRGSAADAVLVLVDGVPANDPLTGEADARAVHLQGVASVRVLPGAHSARHGARAAAGVILVETAAAGEISASAAARVGSLGALGADAQAGVQLGAIGVAAGVRVDRADGVFEYDRPDALGGGVATLRNADARDLGGFVAAELPAPGEPVRLRLDGELADRGLPGPMHGATPQARQAAARAGLDLSWRAAGRAGSLSASADYTALRQAHDDPAPAFGPAYHDTTRVREGGVRVEVERMHGSSVERTLGFGASVRSVRLESTALEPARVTRTDPSAFGSAAVRFAAAPLMPRIALALRADRWGAGWIASHDASVRVAVAAVTVGAAHRSAFSPPAASDQFFGAGFSIAPNPDLEPERVRSEIELFASAALAPAGVPIEVGASAFRGDVDGMIVWAPDFRFVWSPRNRDVLRRGGEAWVRVRPLAELDVSAWAAVARVTYDWPGDADTVQVVYRPRHSGGVSLDWKPGPWRLHGSSVWTGLRYATPGHANPLDGYLDVRVAVSREWRRGDALIETALRVERLLDNRDAFVSGYAAPGRTLELELRIRRAPNDPTLIATTQEAT